MWLLRKIYRGTSSPRSCPRRYPCEAVRSGIRSNPRDTDARGRTVRSWDSFERPRTVFVADGNRRGASCPTSHLRHSVRRVRHGARKEFAVRRREAQDFVGLDGRGSTEDPSSLFRVLRRRSLGVRWRPSAEDLSLASGGEIPQRFGSRVRRAFSTRIGPPATHAPRWPQGPPWPSIPNAVADNPTTRCGCGSRKLRRSRRGAGPSLCPASSLPPGRRSARVRGGGRRVPRITSGSEFEGTVGPVGRRRERAVPHPEPGLEPVEDHEGGKFLSAELPRIERAPRPPVYPRVHGPR